MVTNAVTLQRFSIIAKNDVVYCKLIKVITAILQGAGR